MTDVREIVADEIQKRGFKQAAIAEKAGLTKQQLSDIICKRRKLDANEMFVLCKAMGITPNVLFKKAQEPI